MCIAIVLPAGRKLDPRMVGACWANNSDGAGFAYADGGKVVVNKGHMTLAAFWREFAKVRKTFEDRNFLVHFRIVSRGAENEDNTHPFPFEHGAMIHNGTITGTEAKHNSGPSDTKLFLDKFGSKLTFDVVTANKQELGDALGYNKLAFLYGDGRYAIINEKSGSWRDDVWYSNNYPFARVASMPESFNPEQANVSAVGGIG